MANPAPSAVRDTLDHALESALRLAIDVIEYPANQREEVMRRMGVLLKARAPRAAVFSQFTSILKLASRSLLWRRLCWLRASDRLL
jgi:hypothetical protein